MFRTFRDLCQRSAGGPPASCEALKYEENTRASRPRSGLRRGFVEVPFLTFRFPLAAAMLLLSASLLQADNGDGTKVQTKPGHRVRLIYYLSGVAGPKEADAIVQGVKQLKTVTTASVDTDRGFLKISFDSQELSYHQVAQAINDAGDGFGKKYDPRVVISVPDYAKPDVKPKIDAILGDEKLKPLIRIEAIDEAKGIFFVHFLPLKLDPAKTGTQGFNGGALTHPIHMVPPTGLALPFRYYNDDSPEIPVYKPATP